MSYNMNKMVFKLYNLKNKYPQLFSREFAEFCKKEIFPLYTGRIRSRKDEDIQKYMKKVIAIGICMFVGFFIFCIIATFSVFYAVAIFIVVIILLMIGAPAPKSRSITKEEIKEKVFPKLLSYVCDCKHIPVNHQDYNILPFIDDLLLIERLSFYKRDYNFYEDRFTLNYKQHIVDICELRFQGYSYEVNNRVVRQGGGNSVFFTTKSNRNINGRTVITRRLLNQNIGIQTENTVVLENKEFNDLYDVYSTDQVEARAFLSPALMSRLVEFAKENKFSDVHLSIENGNINLLLCMGECMNMFELPYSISEDVKRTSHEFGKILVEF